MNLKPFFFLSLALLLTAYPASESSAQSHDKKVRQKVDSVLTARYFKSSFDTNYVIRPIGKLTLFTSVNQTGNDFHAKGTVNGLKSRADLSTNYKTAISFGASYRDISASFEINPVKSNGDYTDYEFNLNCYSDRFSIDLSYQRSETLSGKIHRGDNVERLHKGNLKLNYLYVAGYYTFNHRHFSYAAAFNQNYIQRQSAGSWLAGFSYQGGTIKTTGNLKEKNPDAPTIRIEINRIGIGGGYGYNWVPGKKWLLHFSMVPTLVVYNHNRFFVNGEKKDGKHLRFNMIFNERVAVVHNISQRCFAGLTLNMNNSVFDDNIVKVNQNKWLAKAIFGVRLF